MSGRCLGRYTVNHLSAATLGTPKPPRYASRGCGGQLGLAVRQDRLALRDSGLEGTRLSVDQKPRTVHKLEEELCAIADTGCCGDLPVYVASQTAATENDPIYSGTSPSRSWKRSCVVRLGLGVAFHGSW